MLGPTGKNVIRILLVLAMLLAVDNLYSGCGTYIGNFNGGWLGTAVDPLDFWMVFPVASGAIGLIVGIVLFTISFRRKRRIGRAWTATSIVYMVLMLLCWHEVYAYVLIIFVYFILNPILFVLGLQTIPAF